MRMSLRPCRCIQASTNALTEAELVTFVSWTSHIPPALSMRDFVRCADTNDMLPPKIIVRKKPNEKDGAPVVIVGLL